MPDDDYNPFEPPETPEEQSRRIGKMIRRNVDRRMHHDLEMFRLAQRVTDENFGEGTYVELNGFDPRKGETHK